MYRIPEKTYQFTEIIKQSKFITTIAHTPTEEDAHLFIAKIKDEFPDASHNCWAYIVGIPGNTSKIRMSDDGEPHGTAGKPILNILSHSGIVEVSAVVTRYFGGIKLGTGGLVRAYSGSVKNALERISTKERIESIILKITVSYARYNAIKNILATFNASIQKESYTNEIFIQIKVPLKNKLPFILAARDITRGDILIEE